MEDISIFPVLDYDEGFYSIQDTIKKISALFKISFSGKTGQAIRKNIYTRLWRELKAMEPIAPENIRKVSERKTEYSFCIWNCVFRKVYPWLCQMSENIKYQKFEKWEKRADAYSRKYDEMMAAYSDPPYYSKEKYIIDREVQRRKLEIALDYIFSHCIELDEKMLRSDIANNMIFDEAAPYPYDLMVNERLANNQNYYTIKGNGEGNGEEDGEGNGKKDS